MTRPSGGPSFSARRYAGRHTRAELPYWVRLFPEGPLTPDELRSWLARHREGIAERWLSEIRSRGAGVDERVLPLVEEFVEVLTSLLEPGIGPDRTRAAALFQQGAELFGKLGAHRGQAAGEAVEEFQMLREVVLRELLGGLTGLRFRGWDLRNLLFLNRLIDVGVTYASVGHTDTMFFNLVHGSGVVDEPADEVLDEVREQVVTLRGELEELLAVERAVVEDS